MTCVDRIIYYIGIKSAVIIIIIMYKTRYMNRTRAQRIIYQNYLKRRTQRWTTVYGETFFAYTSLDT